MLISFVLFPCKLYYHNATLLTMYLMFLRGSFWYRNREVYLKGDWCSGFVVSALVSRVQSKFESCSGSGHCVVFLGKTFSSHSLSVSIQVHIIFNVQYRPIGVVKVVMGQRPDPWKRVLVRNFEKNPYQDPVLRVWREIFHP